jgi:hypothetical protein
MPPMPYSVNVAIPSQAAVEPACYMLTAMSAQLHSYCHVRYILTACPPCYILTAMSAPRLHRHNPGTTQLLHCPGDTTPTPISCTCTSENIHTRLSDCHAWIHSLDVLKACVTTHYLTSLIPRSP